MLAIAGVVVVVGAVLGGFAIAGGHPLVLFHLSEIIVICGTAAGTVLISVPSKVLKALVGKVKAVVKKDPFDRLFYLEALKLLFDLFQIARRDGLIATEQHIEEPHKSPIFQKYPRVLAHHHGIEFFCDGMRLVIAGSVPPHDLEAMMDSEIEVHHHAEERPGSALQKVGDALPGIGIVAAVLGIVVTMEAISGPVEIIGEKVAAALTGTFLGVLLAYGFLGPVATAIENVNASETRFFHFLKAGVVACSKGFPPIVAIECARKAIFSDVRPGFTEMEKACSGKGGS